MSAMLGMAVVLAVAALLAGCSDAAGAGGALPVSESAATVPAGPSECRRLGRQLAARRLSSEVALAVKVRLVGHELLARLERRDVAKGDGPPDDVTEFLDGVRVIARLPDRFDELLGGALEELREHRQPADFLGAVLNLVAVAQEAVEEITAATRELHHRTREAHARLVGRRDKLVTAARERPSDVLARLLVRVERLEVALESQSNLLGRQVDLLEFVANDLRALREDLSPAGPLALASWEDCDRLRDSVSARVRSALEGRF